MTDRVEPMVRRNLGGAVIGFLFFAAVLIVAIMGHVGWGPIASVALLAVTASMAFLLIYEGAKRR